MMLWRILIIMIEVRHLDVRHFAIVECRHLANRHTTTCGCIGLIVFRNLSCLGAITCDIDTVGFVSVCARRGCGALVEVVQPFTRQLQCT